MEQIQTDENEKRRAGWLLAIAIILITLVIYWVINTFDKQDNPQVRNGKIMQIMV